MTTVKRSFYYYDMAQSEPGFFTKLQKVLELSESDRGEPTQAGQQLLFTANQQDSVWAGFTTLLREDAWPELGRRNSSEGSPIEAAGNDGILEKSHFIFSPKHQVLLFEFNISGPRAQSFFRAIDFLYAKYFDSTSLDMEWKYVPKGDGLERIRRGKSITSVNFSTRPMSFAQSSGIDASVSALVNDTRSIGRAQKVDIKLQASKKSPLMSVSEFMTDFLKDNTVADYERLEVKVVKSDGYIDTIDLVKDHVFSSISFVGMDSSRRIRSADAYDRMMKDMATNYGEL